MNIFKYVMLLNVVHARQLQITFYQWNIVPLTNQSIQFQTEITNIFKACRTAWVVCVIKVSCILFAFYIKLNSECTVNMAGSILAW
jgi:hypothetical protein